MLQAPRAVARSRVEIRQNSHRWLRKLSVYSIDKIARFNFVNSQAVTDIDKSDFLSRSQNDKPMDADELSPEQPISADHQERLAIIDQFQQRKSINKIKPNLKTVLSLIYKMRCFR